MNKYKYAAKAADIYKQFRNEGMSHVQAIEALVVSLCEAIAEELGGDDLESGSDAPSDKVTSK